MNEDITTGGSPGNARWVPATLFDASPAAMFVLDRDAIVDVNPSFERMTGVSREAMRGGSLLALDIWTGEDGPVLRALSAGEALRNAEVQIRRPDGNLRRILVSTERIPGRDGPLCIGVATDTTELRLLERKLQQAQKMEAIGQLAGGVAHDFNNLLTVIIGCAELARSDAGAGGVGWALDEILNASANAAALTRQLLAFSRRSIIEPRPTDLNGVVQHITGMLRRLIGEEIRVVTRLEPGLHTVLVDPAQMDQVLINLAVNARDAMPAGGELTIETRNVQLDDLWVARHPGAAAGDFVMLAVTDTGTGMDEEVQRHLFEPFFTTKGRERGTGLGLAMVYGAVTQNGGTISVYSEPGLGTTFTIYLPVDSGTPVTDARQEERLVALHGTETIALVEDQQEVRALLREVLVRHGYQVIDAATAAEALAHLSAVPSPISLLLTDVVLPQMAGRELALHAQFLHPGMRVLYMSGYSAEAIENRGILEPGTAFLQKPFSTRTLLEKVRLVLDADGGKELGAGS